MPDIEFDGDIEKPEDAYVLGYAEFVFNDHEGKLTIQRIPEERVKRPDYFMVEPGELLEVKEVHDQSQNEQWASWGRKIKTLREAIEKLGEDADVPGTFLVNAPEVFTLTRKPKVLDESAKKIVEAIATGQSYIDVFNTRFKIDKVSDQENVISFSNISAGRSINPPATVADSMRTSIDKANEQLASPPSGINVKTRKLLFINRYIFRLHDWEVFAAVSQVFSNFRTATHINEAWLQVKDDSDSFVHKRIYSKQLFDQLESGAVSGWSADDKELFSDWFSQIMEWGDDHKERLFTTLKALLADANPHDLFHSTNNRTEMVKLGLWLRAEKRYEDVCWLIEHFINDPNASANPDNRDVAAIFAKEIEDDKSVIQITTVLGHLAWVVSELCLSQDHITKAAEYTLNLAANENLYVKSQALIPLNELLRRRVWLEEYDQANGTHYFNDLRELALTLLREYGQYVTFATVLVRVFQNLRDISVEESVEVLKKLKTGESAGWLYMFFALFRAGLADELGAYDDRPAKEQLQTVIDGDTKTDEILLADITWRLWKYLKENPDDFERLAPIITSIADRPYQNSNYSLEHIIEEWAERQPDQCVSWFTKLIDNMIAAVADDEQVGGRLWLSAESVLPVIARQKPEQLTTIVNKLVGLWDKGVMIGHPSAILSTYRQVSDPALCEEIKTVFVAHYEHMKRVQPKLEQADFT